MSRLPIYRLWSTMIQRCTNPNVRSYKNYGARGITVCPRWMKFENFFADMGHKPQNHSLDRIDNNGNYDPQNCRWATNAQQGNNRFYNKKFFDGDEWLGLAELSRKYKVNKHTLRFRIYDLNWPLDKALKTESKTQRFKREIGMTMSEYCRINGLNRGTVGSRLNLGWSIKEAISHPTNKKA